MRRAFDFHMHSWYSYDAQLSPEEIFAAAEENGVRAVCISDHHNMDGFEEAAAAAERFPGVRWVPATEVSASTALGDFDFVVLGLPLDAPGRLSDVVDRYREWMREFNRRLLAGFEVLGVPFGEEDKERLLSTWRSGPARGIQGEVRISTGGAGAWLVEKGVIGDVSEYTPLMRRALAEASGQPPYPKASEVLPRCRELGAVIVVAHPGPALEKHGEAAFDAFVEETGIDGIEAGHVRHTPEQVRLYLDFAAKRNMLVSGGTDIHFPRDLGKIGRHFCPDELARPLLERLGISPV